MKRIFELFRQDSPEYVIAHAAYRRSRGKKPSARYKRFNNPRVALAEAKKAFCATAVHLLSFVKPVTVSILEKVNRVLGLRCLTLQEAEELFKSTKPLADGCVPFVSWENGETKLSFSWENDWSSRRPLFIRS